MKIGEGKLDDGLVVPDIPAVIGQDPAPDGHFADLVYYVGDGHGFRGDFASIDHIGIVGPAERILPLSLPVPAVPAAVPVPGARASGSAVLVLTGVLPGRPGGRLRPCSLHAALPGGLS